MTKRNANRSIGLLVGLLMAGPLARAQQPTNVNAPASAVAFFDRTTAQGCPAGWSELTGARGFYLTGLVSGGTRGTAVGSALTDLENRTHTHTLAHTHTIAHTHTYAFTTSTPSATMVKRGLAVAGVSLGTHTHDGSGTSSASSQANSGAASAGTGTQSTTILPFLQYLVCKSS